ncbi:MAG TPA: 50S ribosomal protein L23 [Candidatus Nanoarchaeia archaeon]|nr:50S ribosomal protein L23 [Candidatus Nanoarchaeia archaeon]
MIKKPVNTEKAIRLVEIDNTLVFEVDSKENKESIKNSIEKMFKVKVEKVNVINRGSIKIAYIRLNKNNPAIDIATKLGMI